MSIPTHPTDSREAAIRKRIDRAVMGARLVLFWELLWPRILPLLVVVGLFLLVSWFGLWPELADWARAALLAAFGIGALAALWPFRDLRVPTPSEGFARLEQWSGQANRPATGILDHLATPNASPETRAIWEAHRNRLIGDFDRLTIGTPSPGVARRDPYALRFLLLLLLVVALASTGGNFDRITAAFKAVPATAAEVVAVRIDAWASPPDYTGRPAIFLTGEGAGDAVEHEVPAGTDVFVRISGGDADRLEIRTGATAVEPSAAAEADGPREFSVTLQSDQRIAVTGRDGDRAAWSFVVIPDTPPTVAITRPPQDSGVAGLEIAYAYQDDYGVTSARGEISMTDPSLAAAPLFGPPDYQLAIPRNNARNVEASTVHNLERHPWAGLTGTLALIVEDAIGQTGRSASWEFQMPARTFSDPLALAVIAERQLLALDKNRAGATAASLDVLAAEAARNGASPGTYLALRSAYYRLTLADSDDLLRDVVDHLWEVAIGIEGDRLADATAALQAATEALREAMAAGAGEEELAQLTEAVRDAMQEYMDALANSPQQPDRAAQMPDLDQREVTAQDLEDLLARIEESAEAGDMVTAEELVAQLQRMMQNLQSREAGPTSREPDAAEEQLGNLGRLMQDQQELMDRTFGLQQQLNQPLGNANTAEELERQREELLERRAEQEQLAQELQAEQERLAIRTQDIIYELLNQNLDPAGMNEAEEAMAEAADRLGEQRPGLAVDRQAEAIADMQAVADSLAEQIAERQQGNQQPEQELGGGARDPIGRPTELDGQQGDVVDVPDEIDRQLAREILDLIRRRLNESGRPPIEIDYLERLIDID